MAAWYFVFGLSVCLILSWNSHINNKSSQVSNPTAQILLAILLTTLFWPLVLIMAYFDGSNTVSDRRIKLGSDDLIQPVNFNSIEQNHVLPKENSFTNTSHFQKLNDRWKSLKQKKRSHNSLWSFKKETKKMPKGEVIEGYALVDKDKNIIDYVIVEAYRKEERSTHILH